MAVEGSTVYTIISIHAPREGGDPAAVKARASVDAFQSTPPARGATLAYPMQTFLRWTFQSTPPARGATAK